jgi:HKD family nuclease
MKLILHTPDNEGSLSRRYQQAFSQAVELFIVTAFLTDWDDELELNPHCRGFRIIIGRDFGITRKAACRKVIGWLPENRKFQFQVADGIDGFFHPKAVFWKEANGGYFAIIGSSNLTRAAFKTNYEANVYGSVSPDDYAAAKEWIRRIEASSVVVTEGWLANYVEGSRVPGSPPRPNPGSRSWGILHGPRSR